MLLVVAQSGRLHYEIQALRNALTGPKGLRIYQAANRHCCCYRNSLSARWWIAPPAGHSSFEAENPYVLPEPDRRQTQFLSYKLGDGISPQLVLC